MAKNEILKETLSDLQPYILIVLTCLVAKKGGFIPFGYGHSLVWNFVKTCSLCNSVSEHVYNSCNIRFIAVWLIIWLCEHSFVSIPLLNNVQIYQLYKDTWAETFQFHQPSNFIQIGQNSHRTENGNGECINETTARQKSRTRQRPPMTKGQNPSEATNESPTHRQNLAHGDRLWWPFIVIKDLATSHYKLLHFVLVFWRKKLISVFIWIINYDILILYWVFNKTFFSRNFPFTIKIFNLHVLQIMPK